LRKNLLYKVYIAKLQNFQQKYPQGILYIVYFSLHEHTFLEYIKNKKEHLEQLNTSLDDKGYKIFVQHLNKYQENKLSKLLHFHKYLQDIYNISLISVPEQ
jgi:vacuolar-type H+-ATPase subunit C/Vma6